MNSDGLIIKYFSKTKEEWENFFKENYTTFETAISVYKELKIKWEEDGDTSFSRWLFLAFYGAKNKLKTNKKDKFFSFFRKDIGESLEIVSNIVNDINGNATDIYYFSYVTKLLNMINEDFYPIYDSVIAKEFEIETSSLSEVQRGYERIFQFYATIPDNDHSIKVFKESFHQAVNMGKMRILDFILYNSIKIEKGTR